MSPMMVNLFFLLFRKKSTSLIFPDLYEIEVVHLIHAALVPKSVTRKKGSSEQKRVTIAESQMRMVLIPDPEIELIEQIRQICNNNEGFFLPLIVFEAGQFLVFLTETFYFPVTSLRKAIDLAFKVMMIFHRGIFPKKCETVWSFVKSYFYDMECSDNTIWRCSDLIEFLRSFETNDNAV